MSRSITYHSHNHQPIGHHRVLLLRTMTAALLLLLSTAAMAQYTSVNINGYRYAQFSSSDVASVDLYDSRNKLFAILIFLPDIDVEDLPDAEQGTDGVIRFYYRRERLSDVIDQLRNESPLRLNYWTGTPGVDNSHITTFSIEPPGEGE